MMKFFYNLLVALLVAFTNHAVPAAAALRGGDVDNAVKPDETIDADLAERMKAQLAFAHKTIDYHRKLEEKKNGRKLWYTYMFDYMWTPGVWSGTAPCNLCDPDEDDYYAEIKCNLGRTEFCD